MNHKLFNLFLGLYVALLGVHMVDISIYAAEKEPDNQTIIDQTKDLASKVGQKAKHVGQRMKHKLQEWMHKSTDEFQSVFHRARAGDKQAYQRLLDAANDNHVWAQYYLGILYKEGTDQVDKSYPSALEYFERASQHNHGGAYYELGFMYENGLGVTRDMGITKKPAIWAVKKPASRWIASRHKEGINAQCDVPDS